MVIDVRLVPNGHSEIERDSDLSAFSGDLPPFVEPVRCLASIDRMEGVIAVALRFRGAFEMECARCLERYPHRVEGGLRVIIREEQGKFGPSSGDDGTDFYFDANHDLVDIGSAIYDEIMVALPLKPLCSEDCAGIAVEAADAVGGIGESENMIDPRWEGLKKLSAL
jgi:uncharacterized protein